MMECAECVIYFSVNSRPQSFPALFGQLREYLPAAEYHHVQALKVKLKVSRHVA